METVGVKNSQTCDSLASETRKCNRNYFQKRLRRKVEGTYICSLSKERIVHQNEVEQLMAPDLEVILCYQNRHDCENCETFPKLSNLYYNLTDERSWLG